MYTYIVVYNLHAYNIRHEIGGRINFMAFIVFSPHHRFYDEWLFPNCLFICCIKRKYPWKTTVGLILFVRWNQCENIITSLPTKMKNTKNISYEKKKYSFLLNITWDRRSKSWSYNFDKMSLKFLCSKFTKNGKFQDGVFGFCIVHLIS